MLPGKSLLLFVACGSGLLQDSPYLTPSLRPAEQGQQGVCGDACRYFDEKDGPQGDMSGQEHVRTVNRSDHDGGHGKVGGRGTNAVPNRPTQVTSRPEHIDDGVR